MDDKDTGGSQEPPPVPLSEQQKTARNAGMRALIPVGRSPYAIIAGYLGLVSVLLFPAPLALIFGILGVVDIRKSQKTNKKKFGMGRAIFGLLFGLVFTVILTLVVAASIAATL
ncbi:MAG: DUF4190 domain-containing protein [Verrucomicrobiota bacterium]